MNRLERERLTRIEVLLERLDAAVVVKDPGSTRSADAFEGLRRTVIQAAKSHRVHVAHLIALDESIRSGATIELIKLRVAEYLRELGVEWLEDSSFPEAFDIIGDSQGELEVLEPAIVERGEDGNFSILKVGKAQRTASIVSPTTQIDDLSVGVVAEETAPTAEPEDSSPIQEPISHLRGFRSKLVTFGVAVILLSVLAIRACSSDEVELPSTTTTVVDETNPTSNG